MKDVQSSDGLLLAPGIEFDLRNVIRLLWRRRWVIIGIVLLVAVATTAFLLKISPKYTATTLMMVNERRNNVLAVENIIKGLDADIETINGEIEILRSRELIKEVVERLKLEEIPEINSALRPESLVAGLIRQIDIRDQIPTEWVPAFLIEGDAEEEVSAVLTEAEAKKMMAVGVENAVLANLQVGRKGRSRVISIAYTSENPRLAALIANTLGDEYITTQLLSKFEATRMATKLLKERIGVLQDRVDRSERAVEHFRVKHGLVQGKGYDLISQQLGELNTQALNARSARDAAVGQLREAEKIIGGPGGIAMAAQVLQSDMMSALRAQYIGVQRSKAELSTVYGNQHPKMLNIAAEERDVTSKIKTEVSKIVRNLENATRLANARLGALENNLTALKKQAATANEASVHLRALERESKADRTLLETFLARFKESQAQEDLGIQRADARLFSRAAVPVRPSYPKKGPTLMAAMFSALLFGCALVFGLDKLDRGFRSGQQITESIGVPVFGLMPMMKGGRRTSANVADYIFENPTSAMAESLRTLHTGLLMSQVDKPIKTVLVTSSVPLEGKTTLVTSLARSRSLAGQRVVVIDTDLRKPSIHAIHNIPSEPGLVEVLMGEAELQDVIVKDEKTGVFLVPAGSYAPSPADLLASVQMRNIVAALEGAFDLVMLDCAPLSAVSDARLLSRIVNSTIFVIRWADTRREVVKGCMEKLITDGNRDIGVVLSKVNVKQHARYGYSDSGLYVGKNKKYYTSYDRLRESSRKS